MEENPITNNTPYLFKVIILSDPLIDNQFRINNFLQFHSFKQKYKQMIGIDVYVSEMLKYDSTPMKVQIQDISTSSRFESTRKLKMTGAKACIIIFDYKYPDNLLNLEKWIFDTIVICGNIPLFLLGLNFPDKKDSEAISDIDALIKDKINSWGLSIINLVLEENKLDRDIFLRRIYSELYTRAQDSDSTELTEGSLKNLKIILLDEKDLLIISEILSYIRRPAKKSSKKLLHSIPSSYFLNLIHSQELLPGIPNILGTFYIIDHPFTKKFVKKIDNSNLISKIEKENDLNVIEHLFYKYSIIDQKYYSKLLDKTSIESLILKISEAWIKVTVVASWSHATISELVKTIEEEESRSSEIISYVSEVQSKKKKDKTFNDIGKLLATILMGNIDLVIMLIEEVPMKVQELALNKLNEMRDETTESNEKLKLSLEIGDLSKREAAKNEILHGIREVDLILACVKHSKYKVTMEFLNKMSYVLISLKMKEEKDLSLLLRLLEEFYQIDQELIKAIMDLIMDSLVEKVNNEPSILITQKLFELIKKTKPKRLSEIIHGCSIENLVSKMIFYFGELNLDSINIPFLANYFLQMGRDRYHEIWNMLRYKFPDIPTDKLESLPESIYTLIDLVQKPDANAIVREKQVMKIFDFFIKTKLDDLDSFIEFLVENYQITKADIKEVFLSQISTEDVDKFSYEKNKLYEFVLNLFHEEKN